MNVLWIAEMFPVPYNWLHGPWNIRGLVALRDWEQHNVRAVTPIGLTPPPRAFKSVTGPWRWLRERLAVPPEDEVRGVPVTYPRWVWGPKRLFWGYEGLLMYRQIRGHLAEVIREHRPDVIHAPWLAPDGVCAVMAGLEHDIPVVVQGIGNDANYYLPNFPHRDYVIRWLQRSSALLFNCHSTRRNAEACGLTHPNTHVIYHGVEVDIFKPDPSRTTFGHRIVTLAQLLPRKNHQLLLRAFARLPEDLRESASLEFIGGGPTREQLERLAAELGIADKVTFAGRLPHEEMVRHLQQSDIYCLPTLSEGMPVATIEAMACGLPVIASRVDGLPESIKEPTCGILVPPGDLEALTEALVDALHRDWDRQAIREHILSHFTWELFARNITELYESLR